MHQGTAPTTLPAVEHGALGDGLRWDDAQIVVHSLETGERKVLIEGGRDARYVPTGHLVYVLEGTLLAVPFDVDKLEVTGGPIPMAEGVRTAGCLQPGEQASQGPLESRWLFHEVSRRFTPFRPCE